MLKNNRLHFKTLSTLVVSFIFSSSSFAFDAGTSDPNYRQTDDLIGGNTCMAEVGFLQASANLTQLLLVTEKSTNYNLYYYNNYYYRSSSNTYSTNEAAYTLNNSGSDGDLLTTPISTIISECGWSSATLTNNTPTSNFGTEADFSLATGASVTIDYTYNSRSFSITWAIADNGTVSSTYTGTPNAPTGLSATAGDASATITFTAPSDLPSGTGESANTITNYEYTTDNGSNWTALSPSDTTSPITITGLTNGTAYSIKIRAVNNNGSGIASSAVSVTPNGPALSPSTQTASTTVGTAITATTAYTASNFTGSVSYSVSPALPSGLSLNTSTGVISGTPSSTQSATTYTVTGTGATSGTATATVSITVTAASSSPTVTTQAVSSIASTTATGNGNLTALGSANPTAYGVCYSTSSNPTTSDTCIDKGSATATGAFTASITGLTASTSYHVRAFATNSVGTSYGADVTFTTTSASTYTDPRDKQDAVGTVTAAVNSSVMFATNGITSITGRLDWLRRNKDSANKSVQGINVAFADPLLNQFVNGDPRALDAFKLVSATDVLQQYGQNPDQVMSDVQSVPMEIAMAEAQDKFGKVDLNPTGGKVVGDWFVWTAGQVTLGKSRNRGTTTVMNESEALNLAIGMDKANADSMFGFAVNGSKDMTDVGTSGSKQKSYGASLSIYGGFNTDALPPIELILGVGHMDISSTRIDGSQTLTGSRDTRTVFGSVGVLSEAIEYRKTTITPYSKLEAAYIDLGGYSESGGTLALSYDNQIVKQAMLKVGIDTTYETEWYNGKLTPFTRFEYAYDFSPSSNADMHYVGNATNYRLTTDKSAVSNWTLRLGGDYAHITGASTSVFYERTESINSGHSDSVQLKVSIPF